MVFWGSVRASRCCRWFWTCSSESNAFCRTFSPEQTWSGPKVQQKALISPRVRRGVANFWMWLSIAGAGSNGVKMVPLGLDLSDAR